MLSSSDVEAYKNGKSLDYKKKLKLLFFDFIFSITGKPRNIYLNPRQYSSKKNIVNIAMI